MRRRRNDKPGVSLDEILKVVEELQEPSRTALRTFLRLLAIPDSKTALRCADNALGILSQLGKSQQPFFLSEATALAETAPDAAAEFFCGCADLVHDLDENDLRLWVEQGKAIGLENPGAAVAFFRRESLAGISALKKLRQSVHIGEVGRLLQLYSTAIAGIPLGVKNIADAPSELVREGHHLPLTDGKTVYLPDQLNRCPSHEENFEEYKVLAAHQAGYIEFGTFDLDLDILLDHHAFEMLAPQLEDIESAAIVSHYELFFGLFEDRQLGRDIFFAIEDGRVDFRIREKYRGLTSQLTRVAFASLDARPAPSSLPLREALVESLIRLSISGRMEETLPRHVMPLYRYLCGMFARILNREATVTDSAVATARVYLMLSALPNISLESPLCAAEVRNVEEMLGDGLQGSMRAGTGVPADEAGHYQPAQPVPYRGQTRLELVQLKMAIEILEEAFTRKEEDGVPLTSEMLEELLKRGAKIKISQMTAKELAEASGLFVTDLKGVLQEKLEKLSPEERRKLSTLLERASVVKSDEADSGRVFFYDEWDYLIEDYRPRWCRLREIPLEGGSSEVVSQIQKEHAGLITAVRRHFQRIRPEMLRKVKRLRDGEEIDLDDAIEAVIDRKAGFTPSERIYQKRDRRGRDVATAFLLDLSASTDEWISEEAVNRQERSVSTAGGRLFDYFSRARGAAAAEQLPPSEGLKRVIDIEREALVIMAEALESLEDEYAIYGFSGYGRDNVEFVSIKDFSEKFSEQARSRIGAIKPRKSTRMGPAIRHTLEKLAGTNCRLKVLILLSDGYPQDFDYGPDRASRDYGLHDTMVALQEARRNNVHTFCVTVDQAGNDYLRAMCGGENYLVVEKPSALPRILPRVYRGLTV